MTLSAYGAQASAGVRIPRSGNATIGIREVASIGMGWVIQKIAISTVTAAAYRAAVGRTSGSIGINNKAMNAAMPSISPILLFIT